MLSPKHYSLFFLTTAGNILNVLVDTQATLIYLEVLMTF